MEDQMPPTVEGEPKKKNNNTLIIAAVVVVVLCCCCIAAYVAWTQGDNILRELNF